MLTRYVVRGQIEVSPQLLAAAEVNPTPAHRCEPGALKPVVVQSARRVDASSRWHLPVALGRPLALAVDTVRCWRRCLAGLSNWSRWRSRRSPRYARS